MAESVDWDELHGRLVEEFRDHREKAATHIDRMRKVVDVVVTCPKSQSLNPEDFAVNQLINELKTVERYIKREIQRTAQKEVED